MKHADVLVWILLVGSAPTALSAPAGAVAAPPGGGVGGGPSGSTVVAAGGGDFALVFSDEGEVIRVRLDGGSPDVRRGDEALPRERWRLEGETLVIDSADGGEVARLDLRERRLEVRKVRRPDAPPRAVIGVNVTPVDEPLAAHLPYAPGEVLLLRAVVPDSPAEAAGLRKHDVLTAIAGSRPVTLGRLRSELADKRPGDRVALRVWREGVEREVEVGVAPGPLVLRRRGSAGEVGRARVGVGQDGRVIVWGDEGAAVAEVVGDALVTRGGLTVLGSGVSGGAGSSAAPGAGDSGSTGGAGSLADELADIDRRLRSLERKLERIEALLEQLARGEGDLR